MKNDNTRDTNNNFNTKNITKFYNDNKKVINGIGIATLVGAAVYSFVKWVPYETIVSKIEEKYNDKFSDREFSAANQEKQYAH